MQMQTQQSCTENGDGVAFRGMPDFELGRVSHAVNVSSGGVFDGIVLAWYDL